MDMISIMIAITNFSLFVFLSVLFSSIRDYKKFMRLKVVLISSFFMFASTLMFYFEIDGFINGGNYVYVLTFISYASFVFAIMTISYLTASLYTKKVKSIWVYTIIYSLFAAVLFSYNTLNGTYFTRNLLIQMVFLYPVFIMIKSMLSANQTIFKIPFFYQIILVSIFSILKTRNLLINPDISYINPSTQDTVFTMVSIIVIITFYVTYLAEQGHIMNDELENNAFLLSQMLHTEKERGSMDELTQVPNRAKLTQQLEFYLDVFLKYGNVFSIAMIDVNHFKSINDTYGHLIGDEVLVSVAKQLQSTVRDNDIVGRWGGDEFLIIFPKTKPNHFKIIEHNLKEQLILKGLPIKEDLLSLSIGFATIFESDSINDMINIADTRMYKDKTKKHR